MPVEQQKCASACKPNSFAALIGCVTAATPALASTTSAAERTQAPPKPSSSSKSCPSFPGRVSPTSTLGAPAPYTRIPRPSSPCSEERRGPSGGGIYQPYSHIPSHYGSLNYGSPNEIASPPVRTSISNLDAHQPRSPAPYRLSRSNGDFYRPEPRPLSPQDGRRHRTIDSGRHSGSHHLDDYNTSTTPLQVNRPRRDPRRDQHIPPWAQRETHEADRIIAELEHKAAPKSRVTSNKVPEPQRRAVDTYRPFQKKSTELKRLEDYDAYHSWSNGQLLEEIKLRRLGHEHEDHLYLVDILMINDHKFFEMRHEFRQLHTTKELLEEAKLQHVFIDESKRWEPHALMIHIADQLARNAVSMHNDLLRAEQVAREVALKQRASPPEARPSTLYGVPKALHKDVKVKDHAQHQKDHWADTNETSPEEVMEAKTSKSLVHAKLPAIDAKKTSRIFIKKKRTVLKAEIASEIQKPQVVSSKGGDSGYSTGRQKSSTSPSVSASPSSGAGSIKNVPNIRSSEPTARRNKSHGTAAVPADQAPKDRPMSKKRARPLEVEKETKAEPPKRIKTQLTPEDQSRIALAKLDRLKPIASIIFHGDGEMDIEFDTPESKSQPSTRYAKDLSTKGEGKTMKMDVSKQNKITEDITAPARKRKSRDDEDDQIPSKKAKSSTATTSRPQKKPLKGIPADERVPGMMYVQLPDGSYELKKRKKVAARVSDTGKRFIL